MSGCDCVCAGGPIAGGCITGGYAAGGDIAGGLIAGMVTAGLLIAGMFIAGGLIAGGLIAGGRIAGGCAFATTAVPGSSSSPFAAKLEAGARGLLPALLGTSFALDGGRGGARPA